MFVGIDWAAQEHDVCVVDELGERVDAFCIEHSAKGFDQLIARLSGLGDPSNTPVAIERPDGRLVDRLLEAGFAVVPVKAHAIKVWRESEVPSGAKSDPGDAEIIAEYLRLRRHRLRVLQPFSDATRALRAVVRTRDNLIKQRTAATNQLEATLDAFWPGAKSLFKDLFSGISLAFLERFPTPASAARLDEQVMAGFLKDQGYSGRTKPAELVKRLRSAASGIIDGPEPKARRDSLLALVRVIKTLNESIRDLERSIHAHLDEHPDGEIFTSLPRSGKINAAQMLAEWGDCREAYDGPDSVAALSGNAPVTRKSGKHESVSFRWACNKRFRNAIRTFADNSRHENAWAAHVYAQARARGQAHSHALRTLGRAWIRVIWRCWVDCVPYDPQRHGAFCALVEKPVEEKSAA